ncbi:acetyl-coenzyme a synthetase [Cerioporus squamosus]|nr:acetyl-coenzyme a synthetase [Cerioporus squamosus]
MSAEDTHHNVPKHPIAPRVKHGHKKPHIDHHDVYRQFHGESIGHESDKWWAKVAREALHWDRPFHTVRSGSFENGDIVWFPEGGLNASYNCVDRWAFKHPDKTAIIYEADEPNEGSEISYAQLLREVCAVANVLKSWGSLRDRVQDCKSRVVITSDEGRRGGRSIATKAIVDAALKECPLVEHVLVLKRTGSEVPWTNGRDKWWHEEVAKVPRFCPPEIMSAEDPLFILYTSGSTGKPKGVVHTTGGYLLCAALTVKYVFDVHPDDKFACMADIGWITATLTSSTARSRTASQRPFLLRPTAIRLLRRFGEHHVKDHDLGSLRVLGSVGEPINPEAWHWYNDHVGRKQCAIVDTFWQTETGSIVTKPGSATVPFFGIEPVILDAQSGKELEGNSVEGVLCLKTPWPSIARTVYQDHNRYLETYMKPYPGYFYTGDGAARDEHGYIWIKGRVDDVINVSGHRLSTAEIESALITHAGVAETAVVGTADELTGQAVYAFVTLKPEFKYDASDEGGLTKELTLQVRKVIGPFAAPKKIFIVGDLPKTRSGKIMRRVLRKIVAGEGDQLGDLSTLAEPAVVDSIKEKVASAA